MVAVVSGSGLGLFGSSASVLGGVHGNASLGRGAERLYVNSATGNLIVQSVDESLAALGLDVSLVRTYNSQGLMDDDNGDNWRLGIHQRVHSWTGTINTAGSTVTKVFGDGREVVYRYDTDQQAYVSSEGDGAHDTLTHSNGEWTWKDGSSRVAETYDANGRLQSTRDADTNVVSYIYTGQLLTRIDDSSGQQTFLDYVGNDLAAIRVVSNGQTQTLTRYYYDNLHRLTQVVVDLTPSDNAAALVDSNADGLFETVDDQAYVTTYTYDGTSRRIASITQGDGTHVAFTYEEVQGTHRVKTYTTSAAGASGIGTSAERVTTLNYSGAGMTAEESVLSTTDTVTTTTNYPLNSTQFPPSWSTPAVLESLGLHALDPQIVFDDQGNGLAVWAQGNDVYARRYTVATNTWGAAVTLDTGSDPTSAPSLSTDRATGDAIVAWGQYDGVTGRVVMSRFTASSGSWSAANEITSWEGGGLSPSQVSTSISGHYAAVAWAQGTSSNRELFQVIYKHGVSTEPQILEYNGEPADQIQVQIDSNGNAITVWRQNDLAAHRIYFNRFRDATQAYSEPIILDTLGDGGSWPKIGFDAEGNAFALWGQWNGLQMRRFDVETNAWGPAVALQTTGEDYWNWQLAVDEDGNALVTWAAGSWSSPIIHARRFDPATGEWGATATLNAGGTSLDDEVSISIDGSNAVAAWVQSNGSGGYDVYAARMNNGAWSAPQLLDTRPESPRQVRTAIDANGKPTVLWVQGDGSARSLFQSRFDNAGQTYTVPSGATWQSIANTLYNINSAAAGEALRLALGNPTLATGAQLTNLPPTLSVSITQSTTVPAYYTVQPTDTWTSITEAVYGTTDPFVVAELQELLDNPPLLPGMHLQVPLVLNSMRTHVRDALGNVTTYIKNSEGRLFAVIGADVEGVRQRTFYDYDHDGNVITITEDPAGLNQTTTFEYDERGNLIKTRDAGGNTVTRTYNSNNQVLSETRYSDTDVDGIGPANPEEGLTTRYVYDNENHLRFTISAAGRVTEQRYNAFGQRVSTLTYTSQGYWEHTASESELESFVSGQPNRERTDYAYDWRGNLATVTVWPETDWDGTGLGTPSITRFVYDQRGNLLQTIQPRGELTPEAGDYATTFTYDGLGRLLTTTQFVWNGESRTTLNDYDDADNRIVTTLQNGDNTLVTTSLYNGAGELVNVSAGSGTGESFGETKYLYDAAGRLRITIDPVGVRTFIIYDGAGRKVGTVDGDGSLTEFFYNGVGELTKTIEYADRLDADGMSILMDGDQPAEYVNVGHLSNSLDNVPGRDPSKDRITRSAFDRAGRLAYTIDELGAVTGYVYDGAGRVIEQTRYANAIQIPRYWDSVQPRDVEVQPNPENDRRTRNFYDNDDKLLATLDPAGYLVENKYDIAGRLIEKIAYATPTNEALRASGSLDDLRPPLDNVRDEDSPTYDSRTRYFYDGRGRLVGELDGEGYLTERIYGDSGANKDLLFIVTRYDKKLTYLDGDSLSDLKHQIVWNVDTSRTTLYRYNGAGEVVKETVQAGNELAYSSTSTEFQYDLAGRVVRTVRGYDSADARTTRVHYDARGLVRQELTAEGNAKIEEGMDKETAWQLYAVTHTYDNAGRRTSTTNQYGDRTVFYYDDDGRLAYTVNALGEVQHSKYDALGRVIETITYARRIDQNDVPGLDGGRVTSEITSLAVAIANPTLDSRTTTTYEYFDGRERITTITAEGASTTQLTNVFGELRWLYTLRAGEQRGELYYYDQRGLLTETHTDPESTEDPHVRRVYDAFGRVTKVIDQYGNRTFTEYDALGRVLATVDPMNARRSFSYDAFSRQLSMTDATGATTTFEYDADERKMTMTSPEGVIVITKYNQFGEITRVVTTDTDGIEPTVVLYEYDVNGQLAGVYDSLGDREAIRILNRYDRAGRLFKTIDGNGSITEYSYDAANRVLTKTDGVGTLNLVTQYSYYDPNEQQRVLKVTQPNGIVTLTRYDRDGRLATVTTDPDGPDRTVTRYEYDDENNRTTIIQGADDPATARVTVYQFDNLGRRISEVIDPGTEPHLNITTQYRYDLNGNLTRKIDAEGHSTWYVYDAADRLTFTIDALGGITETMYDPENRVVGTRRLATATTAVAGWVSNDTNRVAVGVDFTPSYDPTRDQYSQTLYDRDGRAVFSVNPMGGVTHRTFDARGNVTRQVFFDLSLAVATYPSAEAVGNLIAAARGVEAFEDVVPGATDRVSWTTYDARNRAVFSIDGLGGVTKNIYDDADNVIEVIAFAEQIEGDPRAAGALSAFETSHGADLRNRVTRYWYDGTNRLRFTLNAEGYLTELRYNDAARADMRIVYANAASIPDGATLADLMATIGGTPTNGVSITLNTNADQRTRTQYDAAGRVSRVTDVIDLVNDANNKFELYQYDDLGNKVSFQNKSGAIWNYRYDANGRLTHEISPQVYVTTVTADGDTLISDGGVLRHIVTHMTYDDLGNIKARTEGLRRTSVTAPDETAGSRTTTYRYDALGRQTRTTFPDLNVYDDAGDVEFGIGEDMPDNFESREMFTEVAYDTLGNAFRNRDVAGNFSYKVYDVLGRVTHEVDALRHVTQYTYDAFGNQRTLTRYYNDLDQPLSETATSLRASDLVFSAHADDRTITTEYDRLNRVRLVMQPPTFHFVPQAGATSGGTPYSNVSAHTITEYNAFGEVSRVRQALTPNTYADTYFYYDHMGRKSAEVGPLGHLTTYEYDESGDLKRTVEYARPVTGPVDENSYGTVVTTTRLNALDSTDGYDRETLYAYDQLNRLVSETRVGIEYTDPSQPDLAPEYGNQVTEYSYDAAGNQTRVRKVNVRDGAALVNADTYTFYDALGRAIMLVEPRRVRSVEEGDTEQLVPVTVMRRDVYGNLVQEIKFADNATGSEFNYQAPTTVDPNRDRVTKLLVDTHNNVIRTEDASGVDRYARYNERGQVEKEWQRVSSTGPIEHLSTIYKYDALGRQIRVIEPQRYSTVNGVVTPVTVERTTEYNAFGEVIFKGIDQGTEESRHREFFHYDQGGRLWRTNSGDGVTKVYLYDLMGNSTAEIRSQTVNLATEVSSASAAYDLQASQRMRIETRYDALGRAVERRDATFTSDAALAPFNGNFSLDASDLILRWDDPQNVAAVFEYRRAGSAGAYEELTIYVQPGNRFGVNLGSLPPNQTYEYRVRYTPLDGGNLPTQQATGTFRVNGTSSTTLTTTQDAFDSVTDVPALNVSQANGLMSWPAPSDTGVNAAVYIRSTAAPNGAWIKVDATRNANTGNFEANAVTHLREAGDYDFKIVYTRTVNGESKEIAARVGQMHSTGSFIQRTATVNVTFQQQAAFPNVSISPPSGTASPIGAAITEREIFPLNRSTPPTSPWPGVNRVEVNWANLGGGPVRVDIDYMSGPWENWRRVEDAWESEPQNPVAMSRSHQFTSAPTSAVLEWNTSLPTGVDGPGGITSITAIRVYTQDAQGNWQLHQSIGANPPPFHGRSAQWTGPSGTDVQATMQVGNTSVAVNPTVGGNWGADLNSNVLSNGTHAYVITYTQGGRVIAQQMGNVTLSASSVSFSPTSNVTHPTVRITSASGSTHSLTWNYPLENASTDRIEVEWRSTNGQITGSTTVTGTGPNFSLSFDSLSQMATVIPMTYSIKYYRNGETNPYAQADGNMTYTVAFPTIQAELTVTSQSPALPSGLQQIGQPVDLGNNILRWTTPAEAGADVVFAYESAPGVWKVVEETWTGSEFRVDLSNERAGTFRYQITYTRPQGAGAYAITSGQLTVARSVTVTNVLQENTTGTTQGPQPYTPRTQQKLDRWGNVIEVIDAADQHTEYRFNSMNQLLEKRLPFAAILTTNGGASGSAVINTVGRAVSRNYYDLHGRLIATEDANHNVNRTAYNAAGQMVSETHADTGKKLYAYDNFNQNIQTRDELGFRTLRAYDRVGNLTHVAREFDADALGSAAVVEAIPDAGDDGVVVDKYEYDWAGRRTAEINGLGQTTSYRYDLNGNVILRTSAEGRQTAYEYDANDRRTLERDGNQKTLTWTYDYFGRMLTHKDLGDTTYVYRYDHEDGKNYAGLLRSVDSSIGQLTTYTYDEAGRVVSIVDLPNVAEVDAYNTGAGSLYDLQAVGRTTTFAYDFAGRRAREVTTVDDNRWDGFGQGIVYQNTRIEYDALGRISQLFDSRYQASYHYDGVGNRTRIETSYYEGDSVQGTPKTQDLWYKYDSMNRVVVSQGRNLAGTVDADLRATTAQGTRLTYDEAGQRKSATTYGKAVITRQETTNGIPGEPGEEYTSYQLGNGQTTEVYYYDGMGRLESVRKDGVIYTSNEYDKASRETVNRQAALSESDDRRRIQVRTRTTSYDDDGLAHIQTTTFDGNLESTVTFGNGNVAGAGSAYGYDGAGVLKGYTVQVHGSGGYTTNYTFSYRLGESYQEERQIAETPGNAGPRDGRTERRYTQNGELYSFYDTQGANGVRTFINRQGGEALAVSQTNDSARFFYANDHLIGQVQQEGAAFKANFDVNYTPISGEFPLDAPAQVIVQAGDTLRALATRTFGDGDLWYLIADANGISQGPDEELVEQVGWSLKVPNEVVSLGNTANAFKPYNMADALGDTQPTQPVPPPPKKKGCGVLGQILIIVVAIVVTYFTAGAAAGAMGGVAGSTSGATIAGFGSLTATQAVAAGAIGAAVGSAASQGVAIALGMQDSFSWKSVAASALTAGILQGTGVGTLFGNNASFGQAAIRGALNSAIGQGVNIALGLQKSFSWKEIAISGLSSAVSAEVGQKTQEGILATGMERLANIGGGVASSLSSALVRRSMGGRMSTEAVLADVFGNALGNGLIETAQDWKLDRRTDRILEAEGFSDNEGDTQQTRLAVKAMLKAGGSDADVAKIIGSGGLRRAFERLDDFTAGGLTAKQAADRVSAFEPAEQVADMPALAQPQSSGIPGVLEEVTKTATNVSESENIFGNAIGGTVELLGEFAAFEAENPTLAAIGFAGVSAVIGGPTKTFLKRLAGNAGETFVENSAEAFGNVVSRVATNLAVKNKWTIGFSLLGYSAEADANVIGLASGTVGSVGVETALGAGIGQVVDRTKNLRKKLTLTGPGGSELPVTPDLNTGAGYGVNDPPVRIDGEWSESDLKQALLGHPPRGLGSPDLHHAGQMPGSGIHEVPSDASHRNNKALHPGPNQGVTDEMRDAERKLHWWYRAREQGADQILPDWIYNKK
jgi:YD repeat-containing protein